MPKYQSCRWVEHGMVFDQANVIRHCNNFNPKYGGRPVIYSDFTEDKLDWNEFFERKNQYREIFKRGGCPQECIGCTGVSEKEWDTENYIDYILFTPWLECNSECVYCGAAREKEHIAKNTSKYNTLNIVKDMIDKGILIKNSILDFAGGEPTMYEHFEELLDLFVDNGYRTSVIHTNAIKYNQAIEKGMKKGVVHLLVSIDAGSKAVHRKIKGVDSYNTVWANLKKYSEAQTDGIKNIKTKYIVVPGINDNREEIDLWLQKSSEIGVKSVVLNLDYNWLLGNISNIPLPLYELIDYTKTQAAKLNMDCELYGEMFRLKCEVEKNVEFNKAGFFDV